MIKYIEKYQTLGQFCESLYAPVLLLISAFYGGFLFLLLHSSHRELGFCTLMESNQNDNSFTDKQQLLIQIEILKVEVEAHRWQSEWYQSNLEHYMSRVFFFPHQCSWN